MTTCYKCGHEGSGSYCGACGADLRGPEDATSTAGGWASAGYSSAPHQSAAPHQEGWQDQPTSTGYQSYRSQNPANPAATPYRSAAGGGAAAGGSAPAPGSSKSRRSNQMLATLVGVAAVAVFALVAYLFLKPGGGDASQASPSMGNSVATTSSSAPSSSAPTTQQNRGVQNAPAPAPNTVTETQTSQAPAPSDDGASSSDAGGSLPGNVESPVNHDGVEYGLVRSGGTVAIYSQDSGQVASFPVRGSGGKMTLVSIAGCSKPVLAYNADTAGSAVYGWDGSTYQAYKASGNDLYPTDGAARSTNTYGVTPQGNSVIYREKRSDSDASGNHFSSCSSSSPDVLHWDGH